MIRRLSYLALLLVLLSACRSNSPAPQVATPSVAVNTPAPASATIQPSATAAPATATEVPATATLTPTAVPSATPTLAPVGPANFPASVNPLTGMYVADPALLNRRPLAVKIQMVPRGQRPPWGVSLADIVYDYYQNNGSTRLHAIFYGNNADQVGPIRSARLLDIDLVAMYKSIFAFGGADQRILDKLYDANFGNRLVVEGSHNCPPMCRVDPNGFNFLVTNTAELQKYAAANQVTIARQDLNGMSFDPATPSGGDPAEQVFVRFNRSDYTRWDYDPATGRYLRFQDSANDEGSGEQYEPLVDRLNKQQVSAANVVVLYAAHENTVKNGRSEIIAINLLGKGDGYIFRDGQAYKVTWNRPNFTSLLTLSTTDGKAFPFKPGNTWFEVVGQTSKVAQQTGDGWRFTFGFP